MARCYAAVVETGRRNAPLTRRDSANPPTAPASAAPIMAATGKLCKNSCHVLGLGGCVLFKIGARSDHGLCLFGRLLAQRR